MFDTYKIYNVNVFDIKWECPEDCLVKLPTHVENFEIAIPIDINESYVINRIFNKLITTYDIGDGYNLYITQAKIKVNSVHYFSTYHDTTGE